MFITDQTVVGTSIQSATVESVAATDVLQAELLAERYLNRVAKTQGLVNSTARWEVAGREGNVYSIKFS